MNIIILILIILIVVFLGSKLSDNKVNKGKLGENMVSNILSVFKKPEYYLINNIILKINNTTTQIDHILVSVYGIFVIETKNYTGTIEGDEKDDTWVKENHDKAYPFHNPLRQNYAHIRAIAKYINFEEHLFKSIVVFSDNAKLNITSKEPVVNMSELKNTISSYSVPVFSPAVVATIYQKIKDLDVSNTITERDHVNNLKRDLKEKSQNFGLCPICGEPLELKNGKYGKFIRCMSYPRCSYTKKYTNN